MTKCLFVSFDVMTKLDRVNRLGDLSDANRNGVTPPKLPLANFVESLAITSFMSTCD
jgi:hypothetical protein